MENMKKCAIFVHSSIKDNPFVAEKVEKLEEFCKNNLNIENYEIFIEENSFLKERKVFENMLERFEKREFSHLLVTDINQIYKSSYSIDKLTELMSRIENCGIIIISTEKNGRVELNKVLTKKIINDHM